LAPSAVETSACHACGLIQRMPEVAQAGAVSCVRCATTLRHVRLRSVELCGVLAALGLLLFAVALSQPLASVVMQGGRFATSNLLSGLRQFQGAGSWLLTPAVVFTLLLLPLLKLMIVAAMAVAVRERKVPDVLRRAFAALPTVTQWAMVDVFLLGAMIALFRLRDWMLVDYGPALFALGGAALCSAGIDLALDRGAFWRAVPLREPGSSDERGPWLACHGCDLLARSQEGSPCRRCRSRLHRRKPNSVQRTWALLAAAALLLIPANALPVMTVMQLGQGGTSTILDGTFELAEAGLWGLATLVFVASFVVPLGKLGALSLMLIATRRQASGKLHFRTRLFRGVALIGRWSMLDVFATMMLAALAQFGWFGYVRPEPGVTAFCAVVVLTMLASEAFDPRLMWDAAGLNGPVQSSGRQLSEVIA
jgi:paraquat-inducible protein A